MAEKREFDALRETYHKFIYESYEIQDNKEEIILTFHFTIEGLASFAPTMKIAKKEVKFLDTNTSYVRNLVFHIGMVELISYWKCACPKEVVIKAGYLKEEQVKWFKKLYYLGLGEYRYRNHIVVSQEDFMDLKVEAQEEEIAKAEMVERKGTLIPVGGGKDSNVTLDLLKEERENNLCFLLGGKGPSVACAHIAGYDDGKIITAIRKIDDNLIKLNKEGFLNGHTPFSALLAFTTYLIGYLTGKKQIALSNESSAEETNVEGEKINHQYSKTLEFENDFRSYCKQYLENQVNYFSLLRPINELQIAMLFSKIKEYHPIFRSCNVGSKEIPWVWCCDCPKCLFVFIMLSPFLRKQDLISIFGEDLYEKKKLKETFDELCGYGQTKPFECVGTYEEVNYAITKTILEREGRKEKLPYLLAYYKEKYPLANMEEDITKRYNENHNVPKDLAAILKRKVLND